jgi:hypothetical protein
MAATKRGHDEMLTRIAVRLPAEIAREFVFNLSFTKWKRPCTSFAPG